MHDQAINITKNGIVLPGRLLVPDRARGVIVFAHGSGSGKESPRNILVAARLNETGFATLLLDLLTAGEKENYRQNVFDLDLLTARLDLAVDWVLAAPELRGLPIGLAGASTGAAAALNVAARRGRAIAAIVSRGGRPDLA
ncbi:MAG: alpha/beta hydrolase, partial [Patescibacteria group bacterium]